MRFIVTAPIASNAILSITTNQEAIIHLFKIMNRYVGNLPPMPGVFPDYPAPVATPAPSDAVGNAAAELRRCTGTKGPAAISDSSRSSTGRDAQQPDGLGVPH